MFSLCGFDLSCDLAIDYCCSLSALTRNMLVSGYAQMVSLSLASISRRGFVD